MIVFKGLKRISADKNLIGKKSKQKGCKGQNNARQLNIADTLIFLSDVKHICVWMRSRIKFKTQLEGFYKTCNEGTQYYVFIIILEKKSNNWKKK